MLVTGYQLREAIRKWSVRRDTYKNQFSDSLNIFEGEAKPNPLDVMDSFKKAEEIITVLQVLQEVYNHSVTVYPTGSKDSMSLAKAIKLVGGAGRIHAMWKASLPGKPDRYGSSNTRRTDEEVAKPAVSTSVMLQLTEEAANWAASLRIAIASGNAETRDLALNKDWL